MSGFKNIVLDLGGVVLDIDYNRSIKAFTELHIKDAASLYSKSSQVKLFDDLEKGNISEKEFYDGIGKLGSEPLTDEQIRNAWNALLIGLPSENVDLLTELKKDYRLFLLSNTNIIHEKGYRELIIKQYGSFILDDLFEKIYLSHRLHLRKPDPEIFHYVLNDKKLKAEETCFIDDSPQHVKGGNEAGITSFLLKNISLSELINPLLSTNIRNTNGKR